jgi:hypothetical protein
MDTSGAKIWLPGISDPATLEAASTLCGTAAMREHGQDHHTRHPVMTPEMIRQLPAGRALVIRGGHSPVIARLPMCWKDPAYRRARRARYAIAVLTPAAEDAALRTTALTPEYIADFELEPVIPAGVANGTGRSGCYPWDWDDDTGPA